MNREIKFRAWNKFHNTMQPEIISKDKWSFSFLEKDVFVWLQYTGLHDKNGKEIYEGDILKVDEHYSIGGGKWTPQISTVTFEHGCFVHRSNGEFFAKLSTNVSQIEVIGNIYEHPELLNSPANV